MFGFFEKVKNWFQLRKVNKNLRTQIHSNNILIKNLQDLIVAHSVRNDSILILCVSLLMEKPDSQHLVKYEDIDSDYMNSLQVVYDYLPNGDINYSLVHMQQEEEQN